MSQDPFVKGLRAILARPEAPAPAAVSERAGLDSSTIRKIFANPSSSPKTINAMKIAHALGMRIDEIIQLGETDTDRPIGPTIAIAGRVGAGAQVPVFDVYEKGDGPQVEAPPGLPTSGIVAVEVIGDSMEPVYSAGDLLFYSRVAPDAVPDDVIGHRCVVEDSEGMGWVKQVKPGSEKGLFNLISLNPGAMNQHDVKLKWAARVRLAWPADLARKVT